MPFVPRLNRPIANPKHPVANFLCLISSSGSCMKRSFTVFVPKQSLGTRKTVENGWSRNILVMQIESRSINKRFLLINEEALSLRQGTLIIHEGALINKGGVLFINEGVLLNNEEALFNNRGVLIIKQEVLLNRERVLIDSKGDFAYQGSFVVCRSGSLTGPDFLCSCFFLIDKRT